MTRAWTDGRHAENDKYVELDFGLALANVTEGAARSTVLKVSQTEPGRGWQAVVDGFSPNSSNAPATALQPILATPRRCKKHTAESLKVAEYETFFRPFCVRRAHFVAAGIH